MSTLRFAVGVIRAAAEIKRCTKSDNITFGITRKKKKNLKQMKTAFEALRAFKTTTAYTCRFREGMPHGGTTPETGLLRAVKGVSELSASTLIGRT